MTHSQQDKIAEKIEHLLKSNFEYDRHQPEAVKKATQQLMALIDDYGLECRQETEKAFGGCKKCYGKGYATVIEGTTSYADFGGESFVGPPTTKIRYCSCDRGKQLKELNPEGEL